jgi:nucleotide-binding universal stress UspA family protein
LTVDWGARAGAYVWSGSMPDELDTSPVLIAYDGSEFANSAIAAVSAELRPGREAVVLTVSEPLKALPFLGVGGVAVNDGAVEEVLASNKQGAEKVAAEGAELAREGGLEARPLVVEGDPVWRVIVDTAEELGVRLIAIGSHGRSGFGFVALGSVAGAVAQHSKRSVLIAHPEDA